MIDFVKVSKGVDKPLVHSRGLAIRCRYYNNRNAGYLIANHSQALAGTKLNFYTHPFM